MKWKTKPAGRGGRGGRKGTNLVVGHVIKEDLDPKAEAVQEGELTHR